MHRLQLCLILSQPLQELCEWINFLVRPCSPIRCGVIGSRILNMEILMNLGPPCSAHSISYRRMKCTSFPISIPVVVNMRLNADSHIDKNPKVCENLRWINWFPVKLIIGVIELDVLSSRSNWIYSHSLCINVYILYNMINNWISKEESKKSFWTAWINYIWDLAGACCMI